MQVLSLPIYRNPIASRRNYMSSEHTPYFTLNSIVYIGQRTLHRSKRYLNSHTATRHVVFCQSESSPPADITPPQADDPFCSSTDHQDLGHGDNRGAMLLPYNWAAPGVSQPHRTHLVANHRPTALRLNTNPALQSTCSYDVCPNRVHLTQSTATFTGFNAICTHACST